MVFQKERSAENRNCPLFLQKRRGTANCQKFQKTLPAQTAYMIWRYVFAMIAAALFEGALRVIEARQPDTILTDQISSTFNASKMVYTSNAK
jgi:hypothetical protein